MALLPRLLKVSSIAGSIGVYLPAKMLAKGLGFARLLLLTHLLAQTQCGLWGLGLMVFTVAGQVLTLGAHHGLTRYAGLYEARGLLRAFYRKMRWSVLAVVLATTAAALAGSNVITDLLIVSRKAGGGVSYAQQQWICWAALANAAVLAVYYCMLGVLCGLRTYRLAALVEFLFGVAFTALAIVAAVVHPTGLAILVAHLIALLLSLLVGLFALERGLDHLAETARTAAAPAPLVAEAGADEPHVENGRAPIPPAPAPADLRGVFPRVIRFGLSSLAGATLWSWAVFVSLWMTNKALGPAESGVYFVFLSLGQPVLFVADAVWAVVFTHVAKRWETHQRATALYTLETAYTGVVMALMTLTILVISASPLWVRLLSPKFQVGRELLPGLMLFFQVVIHMALVSILAKLQERPAAIALAAACGIAANWVLGVYWLPLYGPRGAAMAAGVGAYVGAAVVSAVYLLACRVRFAWSTYLLLAAPALLLAPMWLAGSVWAAVVALAVGTRWIFDARQKSLLLSFVKRLNRFKHK